MRLCECGPLRSTLRAQPSVRFASVQRRVLQASLGKPPQPQLARVAVAARLAVRSGVVAARRHAVVDAEARAEVDYLALREVEQGGADAHARRTLDAGLGRQVRHPLEGLDVLRAAVRVAGKVEGVHADE